MIAEKAIDMLHNTRGIEKAFLLDRNDAEKINEFEKKDEQVNSRYFGKKYNIGVKKALMSDIQIAFVTNEEYEWPKDNLEIMYQGEIIGKDISDNTEIQKYISSKDYCVVGNIVIDFRKIRDTKNMTEAPQMIINAKTWKEFENMDFVSEALISSPSRFTDRYIRSKLGDGKGPHIGSFIVGLNIEKECLDQSGTSRVMEN